jgi:hypothetical protein
MTPRATNPERVLDKVRESRFFLVQMDNHEKALDTEKFLYCLSAFLSAFRTITFRLYGVTEHKHSKEKARLLLSQLKNHPEIGFLMSRRDVEVHEDGAVVFQRFTVHAADPVPQVMDKYADRFASRFGSRYAQGVVIRRAAGWQFAGNPKNLIELGHDALDAIEVFIRQVLT